MLNRKEVKENIEMNATQSLTGTVHVARAITRQDLSFPGQQIPVNYYAPKCARPGRARAFLFATEAPVTCKRCLAK